MTTRFSCKIQLARHELDQVIEKGGVDFERFSSEFQAIDWELEADRLQFLQKSSPAIGVTNHDNGAILWMSPYRPLPPEFLDKDDYKQNMAVWYVIRLENPPDPPEIIRMGTDLKLSECYFETVNPGEIEGLFRLFFNSNYDLLFESLYSMSVAEIGGT